MVLNIAKSISQYVDLLEQLERSSLDSPDQLFALAYLRGHIDLIASIDEAENPIAALRDQVSKAFQSDRLTDKDKALILKQIDLLESHQ